MFDWKPTSSEYLGNSIVSSYFWIYWVITIPLTGFVVVGWRIWWRWEKHNFDVDVFQEIEKIERTSGPSRLPDRGANSSGFDLGDREPTFLRYTGRESERRI
jgi:hypothetical protein